MHPVFRSLAKSPGFTLTALATLAICLGANLTIFAVVDAILLRPLPFPDSDRLVTLVNSYPAIGAGRSSSSVANYFERRHSIPALSSLSSYREDSIIVGEKGAPSRVATARVTPEFFATLGVPLALGHVFTDAELTYQTDQVTVITDAFWRSFFHADPAVVGKTFSNDGLTVTVVGVLPPSFRFLSMRAQFFRPMSHELSDRAPAARHNNSGAMIARLAPGATLAEAQSQLDALNTRLLATDPDAATTKNSGYRTNVYPLHADHVREIRPGLVLLQCGVVGLLLIGAVNLANLFLIRASARMKEVAVRHALGASKWHMAREVLAETLLVALGGGVLGLLLGAFGVELLAKLGTDQLPLGAAIALDYRTAAVSLGVTVLVGLALAAPVIWFNLRANLAAGLQIESRGGTASHAAQRLRHVFIVAQVALAFVLLASAGLLGLSLQRAFATPAGFRTDHLLTGRLALPWKNYPTDSARLAFVQRLLPAIRALPGIAHAAVAFDPPLNPDGFDGAISVESHHGESRDVAFPHTLCPVTSDFWATLGIPLLRGRFFDDPAGKDSPRFCVVDQAFAHRYWPDGDPLGQRVSLGFNFDAKAAFTIVGVVGNVKQDELVEAPGHGAVYFPYAHLNTVGFSLVVRTSLAPASLAPAIRKTVIQLDPELPVDDLKTMQTRIDDSLVARRSPAILAGVFAAVALLLAAIGTYGVLAYSVTQRRREIGVRMALGALPRQVGRQFLSLGFRLLAVGMTLGVVGSWLASRAMQSVLFEVPSLPPVAPRRSTR